MQRLPRSLAALPKPMRRANDRVMMSRYIRLIAMLLLLLGLSAPARADDIAVAGRGVVRVVTIASADGEIVGFGHGSGFAISANRIVTNAHVVELAARYPDNVVVGVVPSEGSKSYRGRLVAYDPRRDLALIEISGTRLAPLSLYQGPVNGGESVIALGYPGNVDLATAQSAADYIRPSSPVRTQGGFASRRPVGGVDMIQHTAAIARGNSGGPLLDQCGRVIAVNSAITRTDNGDSSFGFAIADTELAAFLRDAKQDFATAGSECTTIAEGLQRAREEALTRSNEASERARQAEAQAAEARAAAIDQARVDQARTREDMIGIAGVLLILGGVAFGRAGLLHGQKRRGAARLSLITSTVLAAGAVGVFVARPFGAVSVATPVATSKGAAPDRAGLGDGKLLCRIAPARSRITLSVPGDLKLDWGRDGCMNGRTQYVENGASWERILVPDQEQTVSVVEYRPAERQYTERRYYLSEAAMAKARKLRAAVTVKACSADEPVRQRLAQEQAAIRDALPTQPDEWLSYDCAPAPG